MAGEIRRVVVGTAEDGVSCVSSDGEAPTIHRSGGGTAVTEIWETNELPPPLTGADPTEGHTAFDTAPALGATRFWITDFGAEGPRVPMHRTESIDYLVVISGSVVLELEDGEVELHAGDVAIQRGNVHAWRNDSGANCRVAVVMLGSPAG
jgi:quercetin dioxygenase-like cupin family protein